MSTKQLDGAHLAILSGRVRRIARKMANTLLRTGRSGILDRGRDFWPVSSTAGASCWPRPRACRYHVLLGRTSWRQPARLSSRLLRRGDAFLHNSPYHGCSHPADHTILIPVIDDKGVHRFTALAKAHQADIGNSIPTTYHGTARDVYKEGALIFPAVKVQTNYQTNEDIVRMCEMRIRVPEQWKGDFLATLGAARIGERESWPSARRSAGTCLIAFSRNGSTTAKGEWRRRWRRRRVAGRRRAAPTTPFRERRRKVSSYSRR